MLLFYFNLIIISTSILLKSHRVTYNNNNNFLYICPGGYKGFYTLGVCNYIKQNYDLSQYLYSGASAGAWNALFLSHNGNPDLFMDTIFNIKLKKKNTIKSLQYDIKNELLNNFYSSDFNLKKLYIKVSEIHKYKFNSVIYNDFESLEDAIDCCIASSHIPLITGGLTFKYQNKFTFDGGFSENSFFENKNNFFISPYIWNSSIMTNTNEFKLYNNKNDIPNMKNLKYLYNLGFKDSKLNSNIINNFL